MRTLAPLISRQWDSRAIKPEAKAAEPFYLTKEYRAWRRAVVVRAGRQCQWLEQGRRCRRAEPEHRMFADHVVEVRDGGKAYDIANGQCLCGRHHTLKTMRVRAKRMGTLTQRRL
jgi:5-methylcytosine-specific restriction protein A